MAKETRRGPLKKITITKKTGEDYKRMTDDTLMRYAKSVKGYIKRGITSLSKGYKRGGLDSYTTMANKTYSKALNWMKSYDEVMATGDHNKIATMVKQGRDLVARKTMTSGGIYQMMREQDKRHPSTKGLNPNQRAYIYDNVGQVFGSFTSDEIDDIGSDRIIQIVRVFAEEGFYGESLVDMAVDNVQSQLDYFHEHGELVDMDDPDENYWKEMLY